MVKPQCLKRTAIFATVVSASPLIAAAADNTSMPMLTLPAAGFFHMNPIHMRWRLLLSAARSSFVQRLLSCFICTENRSGRLLIAL